MGTTRLSAGAWSTLPSASHLGIILLHPGAVKTGLSAGNCMLQANIIAVLSNHLIMLKLKLNTLVMQGSDPSL